MIKILKKKVKSALRERKKGLKEKKLFRDEVKKEVTKIERASYKEEAMKQAKLRGKRIAMEKAKKGTVGERIKRATRKGVSKSAGKVPNFTARDLI